jgi:hypothetical protein
VAETPESFASLDGVQRLYFEENGERLAVITVMAEKALQGAHISMAVAPVVDCRSFGVALIQHGLGVLRMEGCITNTQLIDLDELIQTEVGAPGTAPVDEKDYPF